MNILHASRLAMCRALARLGGYDHALIDGRKILGLAFGPHSTIVDGDATSYAIACASVLAKVTRDRLMQKLALTYPGYGWETNVGYSTRQHKQALARLGPTPFHRRGYAPVRASFGDETEGEMLPLGRCREKAALPPGLTLPAVVTRLAAFRRQTGNRACVVELDCRLDDRGQLVVRDSPVTNAWPSPDVPAPASFGRLVDVLARLNECAAVHLYFEDVAAVGALADLVSRRLSDGRSLVVGSSRLEVLAELRRRVPLVPRSVRFEHGSRLAGMLVACRYSGAQYARVTFRPADELVVQGLHRAGVWVISPLAENAAEVRDLVALGLEFIAVPDISFLDEVLTEQLAFSL